MKIGTNTLAVLKNFAAITPSIVVDPGNSLKTMTPSKSILAKATIDEEFPVPFAIFDLGRFLSVLSLFKDPDLEFGEKQVVISEGSSKIVYTYADRKTIQAPPTKNIKLPSVDLQFTLSPENFVSVFKALSTLSLPSVAVVAEEGKLSFKAFDSEGKDRNAYTIDVGESDKTAQYVFKGEHLKLMPQTYDVDLCKDGISHFKGQTVEYYVAVEAKASYAN